MTAATPCLPALPPPALERNLRQDRHRDFLRRDGAEVEAGGGLDAVEGGGVDAFRDQVFAKRCHLAAAAREGGGGGLPCDPPAQSGPLALALGRGPDQTP